MFEILTDEQVESGRRRVGELRSSDSIEHNIMAILMDVDIGGFGAHEPIAKEKASAIKALYHARDEAVRRLCEAADLASVHLTEGPCCREAKERLRSALTEVKASTETTSEAQS